MSRNEQQPPFQLERGTPLLAELAQFLRDRDFAVLFQGTDRGTVLVVKVPSPEIQSVRGPVPIHLQHALYEHPRAPVRRSTVSIVDKPDSQLAVETCTNVGDSIQRDEFAALARQNEILLLFYD
jgi:hypothetical protein